MKSLRLLAAVAVSLLLFGAGTSDAGLRWKTLDLMWRSSGVTPANGGNGPNGIKDSTIFMAGAPAGFDTSFAFTLDDIALLKSGTTALADTTNVMVQINLAPVTGTEPTGLAQSVTESGVLIDLQVTNDGETWVSVNAGADSLSSKPDEAAANQVHTAYTSKANFPGTNTGIGRTQWFGYRAYRVLARGNFLGTWRGWVSYPVWFQGD